MILIEPAIVEIPQEPGFMGMIGHIDYCAGICYGREFQHVLFEKQDKFVKELIGKGHMRPLEFGTVYLKFKQSDPLSIDSFKHPWCNINRVFENGENVYYVTTNYRYIIEEQLSFVLDYWHEPTKNHIKRHTIKFVCSRAVADEYRTHISLSSLMKSTRYCKMDPLTVIKPTWFSYTSEALQQVYKEQMESAERAYRALQAGKLEAQHARGVLPMDMATNLLLCGTVGVPDWGWDRFVKMRVSSAAAPEAKLLAEKVKDVLFK